MVETDNGWVCRSHDLGSEQWQVAMALGAKPPCKIPGSIKGCMSMAGDEKTPAGMLLLLPLDEDRNVRRMVAVNPSTPASSLERLTGDEDATVRRGRESWAHQTCSGSTWSAHPSPWTPAGR